MDTNEMLGTIYILSNKMNGKQYVGKTTKKFQYRLNEHLSVAGRPMPKSYIHRAIKTHGIGAFIITLIPCKAKDLNNRERETIITCNSRFPNGYNLTDGGEGVPGWRHTDDSKKKMSIHAKGMPGYWTGKNRSEETRRKISISLTGKTPSNATREKMSRSSSGRRQTDETRRRLSIIKKQLIASGKLALPKPPIQNSKHIYYLHNLYGESFITENLRQFCIDHHAPYTTLYRVTRSGTKGRFWSGYRVSKDISA